MRIKIFQMESSERTYGKKFFGIPKDGVNQSLYKNVFYGDVEADNLEDVYRLFNTSRPMTHQGHSLSMSDVVQVAPTSFRISALRKSTLTLPKRRSRKE